MTRRWESPEELRRTRDGMEMEDGRYVGGEEWFVVIHDVEICYLQYVEMGGGGERIGFETILCTK